MDGWIVAVSSHAQISLSPFVEAAKLSSAALITSWVLIIIIYLNLVVSRM
jgi:hypothetical protein